MSIPLIVGAGACKTPASVMPYMRPDVSVGAVVTGSYTLARREGNAGIAQWPPAYGEFLERGFGLNAWGMPNCGIDAAIAAFAPSYPRPLIVSFAGSSVEEYRKLAEKIDAVPGIAGMEANLGCPNAHDLKTVPISYDMDSLDRIMTALAALRLKKPLWLKLSPYITEKERRSLQGAHPEIDFSRVPVFDAEIAFGILSDFQDAFQAIVLANTLPNVVVRDASGVPVTTPNGGQAGLSGRMLKEISLNLVRKAVRMFSPFTDLIACGGYLDGDDAVDALEMGANAVALVSGPSWRGDGPRFFPDLLQSERLQNYLAAHSID